MKRHKWVSKTKTTIVLEGLLAFPAGQSTQAGCWSVKMKRILIIGAGLMALSYRMPAPVSRYDLFL